MQNEREENSLGQGNVSSLHFYGDYVYKSRGRVMNTVCGMFRGKKEF